MKRFATLLGGLHLLLLALPLSAATAKNDIQEFKLKNGMKVLILKDDSIPNANMYTFWKVGSRNELPGITGLSHFFEHMMFNGSKNFPPGSFDTTMEAAGGSNNAYTSNDVTVYTNWFPTSAFSTIVDLEADRIANLALDDKKIESERGVVLSERSTGLENDPWEELSIVVRSTAFLAHPYSWPVIGWETDIKAWTKADLQKYFDTYYNPANAVMVVVGDVDPKAVIKELQTKIEPISRKFEVQPLRTVEPVQNGERRVWVVKPTITNPHFTAAYHIPAANHADHYALDLLSVILSDGPSSRLYKALVDEQRIALDVGAGNGEGLDPELFTVSIVGAEGKKPSDVEKAFDKELNLLIAKGVTTRELDKAKNKRLVGLYRAMETINGKAQLLGNFEVFFGGYQNLFTAPDKYKAVTPADIKRVLASYFTKSNRTIGILDQRQEN
ncbi:MAG: insulinase family protein [Proteobacteria bacterium]|nr:MAG: insulinase family protein [Pseudomonadota bacterium]